MGKHFFLTCSLAFLCMISGTLSAAENNYNVPVSYTHLGYLFQELAPVIGRVHVFLHTENNLRFIIL